MVACVGPRITAMAHIEMNREAVWSSDLVGWNNMWTYLASMRGGRGPPGPPESCCFVVPKPFVFVAPLGR